MKFIPIIILSFLLQGCAFLDFFKKRDEPPAITTQQVNIDSKALELCELLKEDLKVETFEESLVVYGDLATKYATCARKQKASIKLIKEIGNIK